MKYYKPLLLSMTLIPAGSVLAQTKETTSSMSHPAAIVMISIAILLAFVIMLLGNVMVSSYAVFKKRNRTQANTTAMLIIAASLFTTPALAQDGAITGVTQWIAGLSNTAFIFLVSIIALELIIIFYMVSVFRSFTRLQRAGAPAKAKKDRWAWLEKLNNTRTVDAESEAAYNLGHEYDGIEELDNPTPPWWQWGFVASGIFAVVYMWIYFVSYSAPNQYQELEIANAKAEERIKAYMATSASNIDENTVTLLRDNADLETGKKLYVDNCAACHMSDGGGSVGPNLTDDYWIHGGSINDIFRTIKHGVPEKGMKSWKDDFTPMQIAQISSFVHTLKGTTPASAKEPQGDLYVEKEEGDEGEAAPGVDEKP